jgi:protein SCO1
MALRTTRILVAAGAFLAGLVLATAVVLLVGGREFNLSAPQVVRIGGPFRLTDQDGHTVTDRDFKGHPFLVFFGYTHCPDICSTTLFEISEVFKQLGPSAKIHALFITVDPERDTSGVMKQYLSSFDPRIMGLTGDLGDIKKLIKAYRGSFRKVPLKEGGYNMDHTAIVYLMDKDGRFVSPFNLKRTAEAAATDLRNRL